MASAPPIPTRSRSIPTTVASRPDPWGRTPAQLTLLRIPDAIHTELHRRGSLGYGSAAKDTTFGASFVPSQQLIRFGFSKPELNNRPLHSTVSFYDDATGKLVATASPKRMHDNGFRDEAASAALSKLPAGTAVRAVITFTNPVTQEVQTVKARETFTTGPSKGWTP